MSKRGRPELNKNMVSVNELEVEYLSCKENEYGAKIHYLKITDKEGNKKMNRITSLADEQLRMPFWKTDKSDIIIKVKDRWVATADELLPGSIYIIDICFESFCIDNPDGDVKGYYAKILKIKLRDYDLIFKN